MQVVCPSGVAPGDVLDGKYVLRERIGEGGMGSVFLADQPALERSVAIKILHTRFAVRPGYARRFREEAINACRVRNPHCVAVIDCSVLPDGTPYIVMEHVPGRSLGRVIAEESISLMRTVDLLVQILSALGAIHAGGIVHADVKSENFLVEDVDGADHVTMIDFGLAHVAGAPVRVDPDGCEVLVSGTPEYMAPEVVRGEPAQAMSDLYGAGVILYEILTGTTPFSGGTAREIMRRQTHDDVVPPSLRHPDRDIPAALDRVVLRALDKRPEDRFPDATTFARELRMAASTARDMPSTWARRDDSATPDSPTRDHAVPLPRRGPAAGSEGSRTPPDTDVERLRSSIGSALSRGDVTQIANGYIELARVLGDDGRFSAAACELQEGIDILTAGRGLEALDAPPPVNRLVVELAALYEEAGDRQLARRVAATTDRCPTLTQPSC